MRERLEAIIFGHVQGVYFRYYTKREADNLGLTGWVANRYDGAVQVVAEGEAEALQKFAGYLKRGSPKARVDRVQLSNLPATNEYEEFAIIRL